MEKIFAIHISHISFVSRMCKKLLHLNNNKKIKIGQKVGIQISQTYSIQKIAHQGNVQNR